mgnify:CR=1 FL=1
MDRIGWTDLLQSISHLGSLNVGNQPSMNVYARGITTVNFGGTFAMMNEGQTLLLTMAMLIGIRII